MFVFSEKLDRKVMRLFRSHNLVRMLSNKGATSRSISSTTAFSSPHAPSFSSTGSPKNLIKKLELQRIGKVIVRGTPNFIFPTEYDLRADDFLPGAREAVGLVTKAASQGDWDSLEGLVEPQCISSLMEQLEGMGEVEKVYVALNPDDVFFSYISNEHSCDQGNNLNIVTFSLPELGQIYEQHKIMAERIQELKEAGELTKGMVEVMIREVIAETGKDPNKVFRENEIIIGNYRFVRASSSSEWMISELGQTNMKYSQHPLFWIKWKTRLGIHLKMVIPFVKVLRAGYVYDYAGFLMVFLILQLLLGNSGAL